jgi:hypothetical protein
VKAKQRRCKDCGKPTDAGPCPLCGVIVCPLCAEREGSFCCEEDAGVDRVVIERAARLRTW